MEKRIPEPFELPPAPLHQWAHDHISLDDVIAVPREGNLGEAGMRVGVVPEVEAGIEPLLEYRGTGVPLADDVELPLVDEDCRRDLFSNERFDQPV